MSPENQDALRCAEFLKAAVCEYPQMSEDEPGCYASEADQEMDCAAAHICRLVAENEAKDALLRQALDALGGYASCIQLKHHQDTGEKAIAAIRQHLDQKGETG